MLTGPLPRRVSLPCLFTQETGMKYIRKTSKRLRRIAARRLKTIRKQLRKIDLSLSVELNLILLKIEFTIKRREGD
jgi:hypothetical protein